MHHLPATRLLSWLAFFACSAAPFAALDVSDVRAQDAPTAAAAAPAAEPQLAELREQLASLREELDELKSRPTPDAVLEIKRLDEKIDLLQSLLSKPDAPSKGDLDSLREFLSLQDNLVEQGAQAERERIDEKLDSNQDTIFGWMNLYVSFAIALYAIITGLIGFTLYYFGREKITHWTKEIIENVTVQARQQLRTQGEQEVTRLLQSLESRAEQGIDDIRTTFEERIEIASARYETQLLDGAESPEEKAKVKELARELTEIKGTSEYTARDWFVRGLAAQDIEDWEQAYRYLSSAIQKNSLYTAAYLSRGFTLGKLGRYGESLADYEKVIESHPRNVDAYGNAAEMQILTGKPDAALENLATAKLFIQAAKNRATCAYLACIATALIGKDTSVADDEFSAAIKEDFESTWSTDEIERWLEKGDLDEGVRAYIREKTEQFKKK